MSKGKQTLCADLNPGLGCRNEQSEQMNTGSSLLNFMNLASGNVKTALEKPANFKRNINHRRYLQKQLRNYAKRTGGQDGGTIKKKAKSPNSSEKTGIKTHNVTYMKSITNGWRQDGNHKAGFLEKDRNALKERNAVQPYWPEPALCGSVAPEYSQVYQSQYFTDSSTAALEHLINESWTQYEQTVPECMSVISPNIQSPEPAVQQEEFMTGEELTRNLDIKDLYVPELYSADRLITDVQETLQFNGQISPSQYFLPSPSPYSNGEQNIFNFPLNDHETQGLPPIAMAFLSPGSLSHY